MFYNKFDIYNPTQAQSQLFTQFLANSFKSTQTVRNYLAGARTFLKDNCLSSNSLSSPPVYKALRGIDRLSTHIPLQAPELSINEIKHISSVCLNLGPNYTGERAAILVMFAAFLRQSNTALTDSSQIHTLRTSDLTLEESTLWVTIRSSKTIIAPSQVVSVPIQAVRGRHCPITAWQLHTRSVPRAPRDLAFLARDGAPVLPSALINIVRLALADIGSPKLPHVSLHSLRRSASRIAARGGATVEDVKEHGTWEGDSVYTYVPRRLFTKSSHIISSSLAD